MILSAAEQVGTNHWWFIIILAIVLFTAGTTLFVAWLNRKWRNK